MENQCFICRQALDHAYDSKICKICSLRVHNHCTFLVPPDSEMRLPLRYCSRCNWIVDNSKRDENLENLYRLLPLIIDKNETPNEIVSEQEAFLEFYSNASNRHYRIQGSGLEEEKKVDLNDLGNYNEESDEDLDKALIESIKYFDSKDVYEKMVLKSSEDNKKANLNSFQKFLAGPPENSSKLLDDEMKNALEISIKHYQDEENKKHPDLLSLDEEGSILEIRKQEEIKKIEDQKKIKEQKNIHQVSQQIKPQSISNSKDVLPPKLLKKNRENSIKASSAHPGHTENNSFIQTPNYIQYQPNPSIYSPITPNPVTLSASGSVQMTPSYPCYSYIDLMQSKVIASNPVPIPPNSQNPPNFTYSDIEQDKVPFTSYPHWSNSIPEPAMCPPPEPISTSMLSSTLYPEATKNDSSKPVPAWTSSLVSSQYSVLPDRNQDYEMLNLSRISFYQHINIQKEDPRNNFELTKKIGTGSIGLVFLAKEKTTNHEFAIKVLKPSSDSEKTLVINEVNLTINSHHENLIVYHKVYEHQNEIWIIEELMASSLADLILDRPGRIPEQVSAYFLREILKGLDYLHRRRRIHRDLKSDNILLSLNGQVKIGDLGYCVQLSKENPNRSTFAGTLLWMAPEVINQSPYDHKIDIWSLGIIVYELITGEPPYYKESQQRIVTNILNQSAPSVNRNNFNISDELNSFISLCLVKDPQQRANCEQLLNHPFITNSPCTYDEFRAYFEEWKLNR